MSDIVPSLQSGFGKLPLIAGFAQKINLQTASQAFSDDCLIAANNDLQAVQSWLSQYSAIAKTFLTYKRESDRFLLWCVYEAGKTLGQLKAEDFADYIEFLRSPPQKWCATIGEIRISGHGGSKWRPFLGPLSDSARRTALRAINSLLNFLVDSFYLRANPLRLIKQQSKFDLNADEYKYSVRVKILDDREWGALQYTLENLAEDSDFAKDNKKRIQFIFACLYLLGLRISEVANSTWSAFKFYQGAWWFFVRGKGNKLGHIPVNEILLNMVKSYRLHLGKTTLPTENDNVHLIVSKKTGRPLSIKQIYSLIKDVGMQASLKFDKDSISCKKMRALSPHCLRHLSASHQDRAGIPITMIQANLRHSSFNTTKIYLHADDLARSGAMEKITLNIKKDNIQLPVTDLELTLALSGTNVCTGYALEQFLGVVESKIFKGLNWQRLNALESILQAYTQASKFGLGYKIGYIISACDDLELIERCKVSIVREAEIRLFAVIIEVIKHEFTIDAGES